MDSDRRNTLFMIVAIIAVCIVALIAVISVMWRISGGVITRTFNSFNRYVALQSLNYNFEVPEKTEVEEIIQPEETNNEEIDLPLEEDVPLPEYNYNFQIPFYSTDRSTFRLEDSILSDATILGLGSRPNELTSVEYQVQIPKIALSSLVSKGLGESDLLQKGFWLHPDSGNLLESESIFLCHRQFFSPNDRRSCWFIDRLAIGDKIFLTDSNNSLYEYEVEKTESIEVDPTILDDIYSIDLTKAGIKIISTDPIGVNTKRIIVTAKLINPKPSE